MGIGGDNLNWLEKPSSFSYQFMELDYQLQNFSKPQHWVNLDPFCV
jgi:hypothetical protein